MRRVLGFTLVGLGAFAVALGLLMRIYLYPELAKLPLDPARPDPGRSNEPAPAAVLIAPGSTYLDHATGRPRQNATLTLRVKAAGDLTAAESKKDGDVAVWQTGITVMDGDTTLSATTISACLDRHTGQAVADCSRAYVNADDKMTNPAAIVGVVDTFPFDTQQRDYRYFDTVILSSPPMRYSGTETVNGLRVYRFVQQIPPTRVQDLEVPGDLAGGSPTETITAGLYYQNTRTEWVEPVSGIIVKAQEDMRETLRGPDGSDGAVALSGTFTMTPDSIGRLSDAATTAKQQLLLLRSTGPTIGVVSGAVLILLGLALMLWTRREDDEPLVPRQREGDPVGATAAYEHVGGYETAAGADGQARHWSPPGGGAAPGAATP